MNRLPYRKASTTSLGATPKKKDGVPRTYSLPLDLATPNSAAEPEPEDSQLQNEIDSVSKSLEHDLKMSETKPKQGKGKRKGGGKGRGKTTSKDEDKAQEDEVSEEINDENSEELCERLFEEADKKYAEDQEDEDLKSEDPIDSDEELNKPKKKSNPKRTTKADHHSK